MGGTETDTYGAANSTCMLVSADQGKTVKVEESFQDEDGNDESRTRAATAAVAADTTPPTLVSRAVPANRRSVVLTFDENLKMASTDLPGVGAFTVKVAGTAVTVSGRSVSAKALTLTLGSGTGIYPGQAVTVGYADPTGGIDTAAVQDSSGSDAASFTLQPVTNNSTQVVDNTAPTLGSAEVSGTVGAITPRTQKATSRSIGGLRASGSAGSLM